MKAALGVMATVALLAMGCSRDPAPDRAAPDQGSTAGASAGQDGSGTGPGPGGGGGGSQQSGSGSGSGSGAGVGTEPVSGGPAGSAGPARCHTADLTATLRPAGAGAGNRYAILVLTNHTARTCRIYGYGGLGLLDAHRHAVPTRQHRDPAHPPALVTVAPDHSASTLLHWGAVPSGGEPEQGPCEPEPSFLSVIPPDETTALVVGWSGGPVCQQGRIDQWAYASGIVKP